jgi:hypothetical protein
MVCNDIFFFHLINRLGANTYNENAEFLHIPAYK